jgi:hypothetical protein
MRRTPRARVQRPSKRLSIGVAGLDAMLGDSGLGFNAGHRARWLWQEHTLATHFIAAGLAFGERAVIAVFEEHPEDFIAHVRTIRPDLEEMPSKGAVGNDLPATAESVDGRGAAGDLGRGRAHALPTAGYRLPVWL